MAKRRGHDAAPLLFALVFCATACEDHSLFSHFLISISLVNHLAAIFLDVERQSLFGTGIFTCNSFDDNQDNQDAQDLTEPIGFPSLTGGLGPHRDDLGTTFSDFEEQDKEFSAPIPRKRGKNLGNHQVLTSRDSNIMARAKRPQAKGTAATPRNGLRSTTEESRYKAENEELKRKVADLQKEASDNKNKKVKTKKHEVVQVVLTDGVWSEIESQFKKKVWPHIKFLNNEDEELEAMTLTLMNTSEWRRLKQIPQEELAEHVKPYLTVYGQKLTSLMNRTRSEDQSAVRTRYIKDINEGVKVTAKQYLWLLQRPDTILILEEDTDDEAQNAKHREENAKNKYHRDRFVHFLMNYIDKVAPTKTWNPEMQATKILSDYKDKSKKDIMPPEVEAALILFLENNEKKWRWQAGLVKAGIKYEDWKKENKGNEEELKLEPKTKYTSSTCGAKKYGGWSPEARKRFNRLVKIITKARAADHTPLLEDQIRDLIKEKQKEGTKKKTKVKAVAEEVVEEEETEGSDVEFEEYDSEEEGKAMEENVYVSKEEREARKKQAEAAAEAAKAAAEAAKAAEAAAAAPEPAAEAAEAGEK